MRKSNKILAVLMALVMIISAVPMMTVMAAEEEHKHIYAAVGETVEPTCVTKGFTVYKCECGDTKTTYTDALGHDLIGSYIKTDDTHAKYCDRCKLQVVEAHEWDEKNVTVKKASTCTVAGEGEVKCKDCGAKKTVALDKAEHKYDSIVGTKDNHKYVCTVCKASIEETHKWDDGVETTAPKCNAKGVKTLTCKYCKETKTVDIPAKHALGEKAVSVSDEQHVYKCSIDSCGYTSAKENHKFVVVVGKKSLCDDSVALTITCEDCNYKLETAVTEHEFEAVAKYDKDNHKQTCKNCGLTVTAPHNWKDVKVVKAATCKEAGSKEVECKECGEKATVEIPKLAEHTWDKGEVTKEATCGAEGVKTFTCTVCGEKKTEKIAAAGEHKWGAWTVVIPATPLTKGTKARECEVCGKKETATFEYAETEVKLGDVNGDGNVAATDARMILQHVAELRILTDEEKKAADMNEDGQYTAVDARMILQAVAAGTN